MVDGSRNPAGGEGTRGAAPRLPSVECPATAAILFRYAVAKILHFLKADLAFTQTKPLILKALAQKLTQKHLTQSTQSTIQPFILTRTN
jgi:hypothetical protein